MTRALIILLLTVMASANASGQSFKVATPGQLAGDPSFPTTATTVTVSGTVDASDLDYITRTIENVNTLDLSGATVAAYRGKRIGANITASPANTLPAGIFAGLKASHVILPASLTAIGDGAFMESRLADLTLPAGVRTIGRAALSRCPDLREATLPATLPSLPDAMFEGCGALARINLPAGLKSIGSRAMLGCRMMKSVAFPASLTSIGEEAFALSGLTEADLARCEELRSIGDRAFSTCGSLASATLPSSVTALGEGVFFECTALTSVRLPASAVTIPALTLKGDDNITAIDLPESTETIGALALAGMDKVESVTVPPTVTYIADGAFEGWTSLREVNANNLRSVPALGDDVWAGVDKHSATLIVADGMESDFEAAPQWQDFAISQSSVTQLPSLEGETRITALFEGYSLIVATECALDDITLYSLDGRTLARVTDSGTETVRMDTSAFQGHFFIVRVITVAGRRAVTFKLMREP